MEKAANHVAKHASKNRHHNHHLPEAMKKTMWKPGKSGNPHGRPPAGQTIADMLRTIAAEPYGETRKTKGEAIMRNVIDLALGGEQWAVEFYANRTEGRALDRHEITGADGAGIVIVTSIPEPSLP